MNTWSGREVGSQSSCSPPSSGESWSKESNITTTGWEDDAAVSKHSGKKDIRDFVSCTEIKEGIMGLCYRPTLSHDTWS